MEGRSMEEEDIDAILLRTASVPQIVSKYNGKKELADSAMQRMSILTIKMRNVYNDSCLNRERLFRAESPALALAIKGSL